VFSTSDVTCHSLLRSLGSSGIVPIPTLRNDLVERIREKLDSLYFAAAHRIVEIGYARSVLQGFTELTDRNVTNRWISFLCTGTS
jgi:hypothetical protein